MSSLPQPVSESPRPRHWSPGPTQWNRGSRRWEPLKPPRPSTVTILIRSVLIAAFAATLGGLALLKHRYYLYNDLDLAMFVQALERCLHGSTFLSIRGMSWLGDHASYVLFVLAPLYSLARHPDTLLIVQSIVLALGAIPVHRMAARALGGQGAAACAFVAAYLLHPALGYLGLFEFHPEIVATTALLFAIDALMSDRRRACLAWAGLALLAREDVALVVGALGVWAMLFRRPRAVRVGAALAALGVAALAVTLLVVRPRFASAAAQYAGMYRAFGNSPWEIAANLIHDPWRALQLLVATPGNPVDTVLKRELYLHLLLPFAFLPLLAPSTLWVLLPVLAEHLLSARMQQHTIVFQYSALMLPVLAWGAVQGLARIAKNRRMLAACLAFASLGCAAFAQLAFGPLGMGWWQSRPAIERVVPTDRDRLEAPIRDELLARVPKSGGVVAGFEFLSRLANRDDVHSLHHVLMGTYTYSSARYPDPESVAVVLADWSHPRLRPYADSPWAGRRIERIIARHHLVPVEAVGDLVLFARGRGVPALLAPRPDLAAAAAEARIDGALEYLGGGVAPSLDRGSGTVALTTVWRRVGVIDGVYLMRLDVHDAEGRLVATHTHVLGYVVWPVADWTKGVAIAERYAFLPGVRLAPGRYTIRARLTRLGAEAPASIEGATGDGFELGGFAVVPTGG
jgi:uncharacterized membrane protein